MFCSQGVFPPGTFNELGLPGWWYGALEYQYPPHQRKGSYAEEGRSVNFLKVWTGVCGVVQGKVLPCMGCVGQGLVSKYQLIYQQAGRWGVRVGCSCHPCLS